jgi:aconitate hydratase 2 / 2-methylisocitrate dehydratase
MIEAYLQHEAERKALGIPSRPLDPVQAGELCGLLENPPAGREQFLLALFRERISPGVDPAAKVKAGFLEEIINGNKRSPLITRQEAVQILGTMVGGYNIAPLISTLEDPVLAGLAAEALSGIILIYDDFDEIVSLSKNNAAARSIINSWANAEWFSKRPGMPETIKVRVFKVEGEINTDDFSPASDAWSRPDIPLHALTMGRLRFPGGIETIAKFRAEGSEVAFAGDVVGTGSSRKSACNSVLWHIGREVPSVPNKKTGGVIIGGVISPIFFNTAQDSGALPIRADVTAFSTGDIIIIDTAKGEIRGEDGRQLSTFKLAPETLRDEYRAGGRIPLIIGRALTEKARAVLGMGTSTLFTLPVNPVPREGQGYTLAQKIVGRACGLKGVLPGMACEPKMATVGSQDTTGLMTADELQELACLKFQVPMFMQSFCHTAAYPKPADIKMHRNLPDFVSGRGGVVLKPGDGIIHSWLNRLLLPDTVGTGGDSHTRFPAGISFPAGSGLVAFAGAMGFMPLDMPESALVRFRGSFNTGITLRDAVNAIPYCAIKLGLLTVPKKNKVNVFSGRIVEMEGLDGLTVEQAFELTNATAERSAAAGCIQISKDAVAAFMRSNAALMKDMIRKGYSDAAALRRRIADIEAWLADPQVLEADKNAEYAAVVDIDLAEITEPVLACPNDPDDVRVLSEVAGAPVQEVFIGSCMTNIGHFRAAAEIWRGQKVNTGVRVWITPPTRMERQQLMEEGLFAVYAAAGARVEIPGCSLCMGNQARVASGTTVFSTSTRNFDNRIGDDTKVFLGSAELGAIVALLGRIPTADEYLAIYRERIGPRRESIYKYLQFDQMDDYR